MRNSADAERKKTIKGPVGDSYCTLIRNDMFATAGTGERTSDAIERITPQHKCKPEEETNLTEID